MLVALFLLAAPQAPQPLLHRLGALRADPDRAKALALLQRRSLVDCERAVELLEQALRRSPDDASLCLECATARNAVMRIRTDSNTLHITRMLDTPDNKRVWALHGPRALSLAKRAKEARPSDPEALLAYCDAFFFANSVKGVLASATTGSGLKFKANAKELISRAPRLDGGIGHCYLGVRGRPCAPACDPAPSPRVPRGQAPST